MSCRTSEEDFFTLAEVQAFLCENSPSLLPSASHFARRKIRYKIWHQEVPEPEEIVHIVFEKYWSGSRKMRKAIIPQAQVFLAIASVLSNLATHSENRRMTSLFAGRAEGDSSADSQTPDFEDPQTPTPDEDLSSREECERLIGLLSGNELDHRVLEFILTRPEKSSREFRHAVRPRVIADELSVSRHEIYRSFERMRKMIESVPSTKAPFPRRPRKRATGNDVDEKPIQGPHSHNRSRIHSGPKFMKRQNSALQTCESYRDGEPIDRTLPDAAQPPARCSTLD
jgi:hypothetical protein